MVSTESMLNDANTASKFSYHPWYGVSVLVLFSTLHTPAVQTLLAVFEGSDFAIRTRSFAARELTTEQAGKTNTDTCQTVTRHATPQTIEFKQ